METNSEGKSQSDLKRCVKLCQHLYEKYNRREYPFWTILKLFPWFHLNIISVMYSIQMFKSQVILKLHWNNFDHWGAAERDVITWGSCYGERVKKHLPCKWLIAKVETNLNRTFSIALFWVQSTLEVKLCLFQASMLHSVHQLVTF